MKGSWIEIDSECVSNLRIQFREDFVVRRFFYDFEPKNAKK